jgi:mono/diheme cytochrome c family protein
MEVFVKIISLKKMSVPKVAVLATGLAAALLAATVNPAPVAQAFPTKAANCAGCHAVGGSTTAAPSTLTPAAGASYTVAITLAANPAGGNSGYAIVPVAPAVEKTNGGNTSSALSYTATMTAPAAAGTYTYNVYTNQGLTDPAGQASGTSYTITVAPVVTVPPTTVPPTTVPPTTVPPTTVPPTTVPPTTVPPTTVPPVLTPPTSTTSVLSLSPNHGKVGTKVTIRGNGFGKAGLVKFGAGKAKVVSWTRTSIVVKVPSTYIVKVESESRTFSAEPVWYRHDPSSVLLTVTPQGASVSNAVGFRVDSQKDDHGRGDNHNR